MGINIFFYTCQICFCPTDMQFELWFIYIIFIGEINDLYCKYKDLRWKFSFNFNPIFLTFGTRLPYIFDIKISLFLTSTWHKIYSIYPFIRYTRVPYTSQPWTPQTRRKITDLAIIYIHVSFLVSFTFWIIIRIK